MIPVSLPGSSSNGSKILLVVVGVAVGMVLGLLLGAVIQPASNSGGGSTPVSSAASVHSHTWAVNSGAPQTGSIGPVSVYSHAWAVNSGPTTTTPSMSVLAGSVVYLFVGYVNEMIGGGLVSSISDTASDSYSLVTSTGYTENHTEDLYVSEPVPQNTTLNVSVSFSGGVTTMGGSVAAVDVAGSGTPTVDGVNWESGVGGTASVAVHTNSSNDLLLLGVSGQQKDAPFVAASGETLLDTGDNTAGPFEDGMGLGTFSASEVGASAVLSAQLNNSAVWNAIGVGIIGCHGCSAAGATTTPAVSVLAGSAVYVFVGYVNTEIGGGYVSSITDTAGDSYVLVTSTGYAQNHTEDLYVAEPVFQNTMLNVSVSFSGGATKMGGSVAVVDVTGSGIPTVDGNNTASGVGKVASVGIATVHANDLLLLGVSGQQKDAPFVAASGGVTGETLLDTGDNTAGPFEDGMGFGTFSAFENGTVAGLSAQLNNSAVWNAIGVGIFVTPHPTAAPAGFAALPAFGVGTTLAAAVVRPS
ncbi:MAG: hypothetical protein ACLPWO_07775 [Thermoplasmata archaeon]